ncbi:MAG: adenylate kinase family protein [Gemmatimonadaceae bacterium]
MSIAPAPFILVTGPAAAGKSMQADALATRLHLPVVRFSEEPWVTSWLRGADLSFLFHYALSELPRGAILDGLARSALDVRDLLGALAGHGHRLTAVVHLRVTEAVAIQRVSAQRPCAATPARRAQLASAFTYSELHDRDALRLLAWEDTSIVRVDGTDAAGIVAERVWRALRPLLSISPLPVARSA